jgi:hypothetical protein
MTTEPTPAPMAEITFTLEEHDAIEISLRCLAHYLQRCAVTGMYYLPSSAGFACNADQARAIESALEKIAQY